VWQEPLVVLRFPKLFTMRGDPFERGDRDGAEYKRWRMDRLFMLGPAAAYVGQLAAELQGLPAPLEARLVQT
jgi:arylsulfatase